MLRGLAGHLVADPATADDAVQEAWLAALQRRPDASRPLEPWLKRVLRGAVARLKRTRVRVARREHAAARPERAPDVAALAERARLLRTLLDEVLTLPELERETVLLRYYEGLAPREIAPRLALPVDVVHRRLEQALERLRRRMDAQHGGARTSWCVGLVATLGLPRELLSPALASAAGLSSGGAVGSSVAAAGASSTSLSGVMLMGSTATTVTVSAIALGAGLGLGWLGHSTWSAPEAPALEREGPEAPSEEGLQGGAGADASPRLVGSAASKREAQLQSEIKSLREQVGTLTAQKTALEEERAAANRPFDPKALRFGITGPTPQFDKANWTQLASHMVELAKLMPKLGSELVAGGEPSAEMQQDLAEHNTPLAIFAVVASAELKGSGPNGAYTHPAVLANLIRAALLAANDPLTPAQELAIVTLGNAWAADAERSAKALSPDAPALAATIVEVDAKLRFLEGAKAQLSPSQRAVLFHPETEGRLLLDLLSPALVYMQHGDAGALSAEALPAKAIGTLLGAVGVKEPEQAAYLDLGQRWVSEAPWGVEPRAPRDPATMFPTVDTLQAFARAQVSATARVLERGQLAPEQAAKLRKLRTLVTPYVVQPK